MIDCWNRWSIHLCIKSIHNTVQSKFFCVYKFNGVIRSKNTYPQRFVILVKKYRGLGPFGLTVNIDTHVLVSLEGHTNIYPYFWVEIEFFQDQSMFACYALPLCKISQISCGSFVRFMTHFQGDVQVYLVRVWFSGGKRSANAGLEGTL